MKSFLSLIFSAFLSLIVNIQATTAAFVSNDMTSETDRVENSFEKKGSTDIEKNSKVIKNDDIFGDEQTFPFVAGLGKNAAH